MTNAQLRAHLIATIEHSTGLVAQYKPRSSNDEDTKRRLLKLLGKMAVRFQALQLPEVPSRKPTNKLAGK